MNKLLQICKFGVLCIILGIIFSSYANGQGCVGAIEEFERLEVVFDNFKVYPSLAPRSLIKIGYASINNDIYKFDESNLSDYIIVKKGNPITKALKIERFEEFKGYNYLVFDAKSNDLKKDDELNVGICLTKELGGQITKVLLWDTDNPNADPGVKAITKVPEIELYTLNATPNVVPNQELNDGSKRTVGQLKFDIDVPSVIRNGKVARFYFNTNNIISTNWRDNNSKLEIKLGAERSLTPKWYIPINFEAKINGDQRVQNATFVATSGITTTLPWAKTRKVLFNQLVRAPVSPEFGLNAEYYRRIKQDADSLIKFPKKDSFALTGQFKWNPIQLFTPSCKKTDDQGNPVFISGTTEIEEDFEKCFSAQNISLELSAKGWWFPYEKSILGNKVKKYEGRAEISLLIPLRNIADQFLFKKTGDKPINATNRVRVKYVVGANDANGFKRVSQLTFGIELIK